MARRQRAEGEKSPGRRVAGCLGDVVDGCAEGCALPVLALAAAAALVALVGARRRRD
jgi:hypothetical protein